MSSSRVFNLKKKQRKNLFRLLHALNNTWEFFKSKSFAADDNTKKQHALAECQRIVAESLVLTNLYNTIELSYDFEHYKFNFKPVEAACCRKLDSTPIQFEFYWNGNAQCFRFSCNADTELSHIPDYVIKPIIETIMHLIAHSEEWAEAIEAVLEGKIEELAAEEFPKGLVNDIG